jgi:hypothetical protein
MGCRRVFNGKIKHISISDVQWNAPEKEDAFPTSQRSCVNDHHQIKQRGG